VHPKATWAGKALETFLFGQWDHDAVWTVFNCDE